MLHSSPARLTLLLLAATLMPNLSGAQDDDKLDRRPVDCISVPSIDDTEVIDDRTVLFFLRGEKVYRNYLPKACPGLERQDSFSYRTTGSRLCEMDTITVLERDSVRAGTGFTCALGEFRPISPDEVDELSPGPTSLGRSAIEVEVVELPDDAPQHSDQDPERDPSEESSEE